MSPTSPARDIPRAVAEAVAHDLNNQLTIMYGLVDGLLAELAGDDLSVPALVEIQEAASRCAARVKSLLAYSARCGARGSAATLEQVIDEQGGIVPE